MESSVFLIGLGAISVGYDLDDKESLGRTHARAVERHKDFFLASGYDPSEAKRIEFSKFYNKPTYAELEPGLKQVNPEIVVIASPTEMHSTNIEQVLNWCSPKIILCEKPIATDLSTINEMIQSCSDRNIALYVNYFRNSEPSSIEIAEAIKNQIILKPFSGTCTYNKGSHHTATHFLNLFELWFGEVLEITPKTEKLNLHNPRDPNYEFQVIYPGGTMDFQVATDSNTLTFQSEIQFSNGLLQYKNEGEEIIWIESNNNGDFGKVAQKSIKTSLNKGIYNVWDEISNLIHLKTHNLCTAERAQRYIVQIEKLKRNRDNVT